MAAGRPAPLPRPPAARAPNTLSSPGNQIGAGPSAGAMSFSANEPYLGPSRPISQAPQHRPPECARKPVDRSPEWSWKAALPRRRPRMAPPRTKGASPLPPRPLPALNEMSAATGGTPEMDQTRPGRDPRGRKTRPLGRSEGGDRRAADRGERGPSPATPRPSDSPAILPAAGTHATPRRAPFDPARLACHRRDSQGPRRLATTVTTALRDDRAGYLSRGGRCDRSRKAHGKRRDLRRLYGWSSAGRFPTTPQSQVQTTAPPSKLHSAAMWRASAAYPSWLRAWRSVRMCLGGISGRRLTMMQDSIATNRPSTSETAGHVRRHRIPEELPGARWCGRSRTRPGHRGLVRSARGERAIDLCVLPSGPQASLDAPEGLPAWLPMLPGSDTALMPPRPTPWEAERAGRSRLPRQPHQRASSGSRQ